MYPLIKEIIAKIRFHRPLILNITNQVSTNFVANGLLSLGASPLMIQALEECEELIKISQAVVINIGTLNPSFIELSEQVMSHANRLGKPAILDPVGAGASYYRTQTCRNLLQKFRFLAIKGNASEIMALSGTSQNTKGVDSNNTTDHALKSAESVLTYSNCLVAISGKTDALVDKNNVTLFERGSFLMPLVTGSGCLLSAVIAAFCAVHSNAHEAISAALLFYGVCGERAEKQALGPGTFAPYFIDALSHTPEGSDYE